MPLTHYFTSTSGFPQTSGNRTLAEILDDLSDYVGGGDRPAAQERARRSLQAAVRKFNMVAWRFNRQQQTITLINNTTEYDLNATFRSPRAAILLDSNGRASGALDWIKYEDWARYEADDIGTATQPEAYTCRNAFLTGKVTFIPRLGTINTQYPTVRLDYHSRIVVPSTDDAVLLVPLEVEEAIVAEAVAIIVAKTRSFAEAAAQRIEAKELKADTFREWRDFPDSGQHNEA